MDDPQEIAKEIAISEARSIEARVEYLHATYSIFDRNFSELRRLLERFRDAEPDVPIWSVDRRYELGAIGQEALRLLHNYVASAKTLVDVTRILIRSNYGNEPFLIEYQSEVEERFAQNAMAQFVQDLRNYMLHFSIPITYAQLEIGVDDETGDFKFESSFILDLTVLREWGNWSGPAQAYLAAQSGDLDILGFSSEYHTLVQAFQAWLQRRIGDLHSSEFDWLREMRKKLESAKGQAET